MAQTTVAPSRLHSGNPALSEKFVETHLTAAAPRPMTVAGVSVKTLVLLVVLVAGGAWGWAAATTSGVDLGSGYANTTVTIPGGFWLASFGAFFLGIFIAVQPRRAALLGVALRRLRGVLPRRDLGHVRRTDRRHRRRRGPVDVVRVRRRALSVRHPHRQADTEDGVRRDGRDGRAVACCTSSSSSCRSSTGAGSTATASAPSGVVVTLLAIVLAALSLVLDFGTIEAGVRAGAPKEFEWYLAFGLMVTLIWLYISILKLLALLSRNR